MALEQKPLDSCRYVSVLIFRNQLNLSTKGTDFPKIEFVRATSKIRNVLVFLKVCVDDRIFYGLKIKIRAFRSSADTTIRSKLQFFKEFAIKMTELVLVLKVLLSVRFLSRLEASP